MSARPIDAGASPPPATAGRLSVRPRSSVLATGAWLKNAACRLDGDAVDWSAPHGDLSDPAHCAALDASLARLVDSAPASIVAVAHDLHPDFFSSRLACSVAQRLGVPAIAVQHHHAHVAVVLAEAGLAVMPDAGRPVPAPGEPVIGLALDGFGLGSDGQAWGGELLLVGERDWRRLGHLHPLRMPGGDAAAREPWRMAAALLHACGRADEIVARLAPRVGAQAAGVVRTMLARGVNCPATTSAGRWFDAAAGALALCDRQREEAEAAIAMELLAARRLAGGARGTREAEPLFTLVPGPAGEVLDLRPLGERLLDIASAATPAARAEGAALFHVQLAQALVAWARNAAHFHGLRTVALVGGCFANRPLREHVADGLVRHGLVPVLPRTVSCGDAGLALGQAMIAGRS
jgi:hydrogenase maturation protein HypF